MEKELLIHEFLDGTLKSEKEAELFSLLASSEEAKIEFKKQLAVKTTIKGDTAAFTAPASSAVSIFSELGISSALGAGAIAGASQAGGFSKFWAAYQQGVITFLGTALSAVIIYFTLDFGFGGDSSQEITKSEPQKIIEYKDKIIEQFVFTNDPEKLSGDEKQNAINSQNRFNALQNEIYSLRNQNNELQKKLSNYLNSDQFVEIDSKEGIEEQKSFLKIGSSDYAVNNSINLNIQTNFAAQPINSPDFNFQQSRSLQRFVLPYNLEITSMNDFFLDQTNNQLTGNNFDNLRLELSMNVNGNWSFGLDLRNENFYQKYNYIIDGQPYILEQNPNFYVYSGLIKYSPDFVKGEILGIDQEPFAQITLGAGTPGPVGRLMIGTKFDVFNGLYLKTGLEYSYLNYTQDNLNYQSDKISLQLGIGFSNR